MMVDHMQACLLPINHYLNALHSHTVPDPITAAATIALPQSLMVVKFSACIAVAEWFKS